MSVAMETRSAPDSPDLERVASLLGGQQVLRHPLRSQIDAHQMIDKGLPGRALFFLVTHFSSLGQGPSLEKALGMSWRTYQRRQTDLEKPLSPEQSGRTWKFAEVLARATAVLGSKEAAEEWLECPAMGLDNRRPIELLSTPAGVEMVEDFLRQLEYGVYV